MTSIFFTKLKTRLSLTQIILQTVFIICCVQTGFGQKQKMKFHEGETISCPGIHKNAHTRVPAKMRAAAKGQKNSFNSNPGSQFEIIPSDAVSDFPEALKAFQFALDIWANELVSDVPIRVTLDFAPREISENRDGSTTLASAGSVYFVSDFPNAPVSGLIYPAPLANALAGEVLMPERSSEIRVTFNSNINWYFGLDGNTPADTYDFVTIALHELGHGLGFAASQFTNFSSLNVFIFLGNRPYDKFIVDNMNKRVVNVESDQLLSVFTRNNLFMDGFFSKAALQGTKPKIFSPRPFNNSSSLSHWDEGTFLAGNSNSLMTPRINTSESNFDIGNITRGLFKDMGWELNDPNLFPINVNKKQINLITKQINDVATEEVIITNTGTKTITIEVSTEDSNTITVLDINKNIVLNAGESTPLTIITQDTSTPGSYNSIVKLNISGTDITATIPVSLEAFDNSITVSRNKIDTTIDIESIASVSSTEIFTLQNIGNTNVSFDLTQEIAEGTADFMSFSPSMGTIAPGASVEIATKLSASRLDNGLFLSTIIITTDDADTQVLRIPVTFEVTNQIGRLQQLFPAGGASIVGGRFAEDLQVNNVGTQKLTISDIYLSDNMSTSIVDWNTTGANNTIAPRTAAEKPEDVEILEIIFDVTPMIIGAEIIDVNIKVQELKEPFVVPIRIIGLPPLTPTIKITNITEVEKGILELQTPKGENTQIKIELTNPNNVPLTYDIFYAHQGLFDNILERIAQALAPLETKELILTVDTQSFDVDEYSSFLFLGYFYNGERIADTGSIEITNQIFLPAVEHFSIVNSDNGEVLQLIENGATIAVDELDPYTILANVNATSFKSVIFDLDQQASFRIDNRAPFSLAGELDGALRPLKKLALGDHTLTATPFSGYNGRGNKGEALSVNFTLIDSSLPVITEFNLVNTSTKERIKQLKNGDTLNYTDFKSNAYDIVAEVSDLPVVNVGFDYDNQRKTHFDSSKPYSTGRAFRRKGFTIGTNTLSATPFVRDSNGRLVGNPKTIQFEVVNTVGSKQSSKNGIDNLVLMTPNPVSDFVTIESKYANANIQQVRLSNIVGQQIDIAQKITRISDKKLIINAANLASGYYHVAVIHSDGQHTSTRLIKQ